MHLKGKDRWNHSFHSPQVQAPISLETVNGYGTTLVIILLHDLLPMHLQ